MKLSGGQMCNLIGHAVRQGLTRRGFIAGSAVGASLIAPMMRSAVATLLPPNFCTTKGMSWSLVPRLLSLASRRWCGRAIPWQLYIGRPGSATEDNKGPGAKKMNTSGADQA